MPTPRHPEYIWYPPYRLALGSPRLQVSGDAWASYLGLVDGPLVIDHLEMQLSVLAAGTQTAEMGLFSSPDPPSGDQTLTKIVASGNSDLTDMTSGSVPFLVRNTTAWAQAIPPGTHLWGVTRFAMSVTQPEILEGIGQSLLGDILQAVGASALTGLTTLAMIIPTQSVINHAPTYVWARGN